MCHNVRLLEKEHCNVTNRTQTKESLSHTDKPNDTDICISSKELAPECVLSVNLLPESFCGADMEPKQ